MYSLLHARRQFIYVNEKLWFSRRTLVNNKLNEQLLHQSSFEKGRISPRGILGFPDCINNSGETIAEFKSGIEGNERGDSLIPAETKAFVNNNNTLKPNTWPEIANNRRENLNMNAHQIFVNSDRKGLKLENHCKEKGDEFD